MQLKVGGIFRHKLARKIAANFVETAVIQEGNLKYLVDFTDTRGPSNNLLRSGISGYEPGLVAWIKNHIDGVDCFIDVGANIGIVSIQIAKSFPELTVYSFEPEKRSYSFLEKNKEFNELANLNPINLGLGDKTEERRLKQDKNNRGGFSLVDQPHLQDPQDIKVTTLDTWFQQGIQMPNSALIKVDIEGFEPQFFSGANQFIEKLRPKIIFEFSGFLYKAQGLDPLHTIILLRNKGYRLFSVDSPDQNLSDEYLLSLVNQKKQIDIACIPG